MQQEQQQKQTISRWPLVIAGGFFIVILLVFIVEFVALSGSDGGLAEDSLTADAYMEIVTPLLVNADAARGAEIMELRGCTLCHGNQNLAPAIDVIIANAGERRPPMQASAYIYESIVHPGAYVVSGYQNNMPRTYGDSIPDDELGHLIAYLSGMGGVSAVDALPTETTTDAEEQVPALIIEDLTTEGGTPLTPQLIREYEDVAAFLLTGASATRGADLVEDYGCNVCHGGAAAGILAPTYADTALNGQQRRPPLSLAAYIYEAIVYPGRYVAEGWTNAMPGDYDEIISSGELGDMMAYILSYAGE